MQLASRTILFSLAIIAIIFAYLTWEKGDTFALFIVPAVVAIAVVFVLSPQVDWWWYNKHPQDIEPMMARLFQQHLGFYQALSDVDKLKFRQRVGLYLMTVEFVVPSKDEEKQVPDDLKHWVAAFAVMTTWHKPAITQNKFEKIVAYMRPFPSPQYPQHLHATEIFEEDGVVLLAFEPMLQAVMSPTRCFNPVLYEFCKVYKLLYPSEEYGDFDEDNWATLEQISGFSKEHIYATIGIPDVDIESVARSFLLLFPEKFVAAMK